VRPLFVRGWQQPAAPEMQQVLHGLPRGTHEPNVHYAHFDVNHHDREHDVHYRESWHVHRLFPVRRPELVWMHPVPRTAGVQVQRQGSLDEGVRGPPCGAYRESRWYLHRLFAMRRSKLVRMHLMSGRPGVQAEWQGSLDEGVRG
jgi:hypothetical protein